MSTAAGVRTIGLVAAVGLVGWSAGQPPAVVSAAPVGAVGCASSNCHGTAAITTGKDAWRSSYTKWAADDPHRRAFASLDPMTNEIAARMLHAFEKADPTYEPATDERCLACHVGPALVKTPTLFADGVSCEACHGPAERWLTAHTRSTHVEGVKLGMIELNPLADRAKACAGCHVGSGETPVRDMNHDMIAAGHPRLVFEFATHSQRMPAHWFDRNRANGVEQKPFSAAGWLAGLAPTAAAACELTVSRATRADPWPELAEWNCYGCHHNLIPGGSGRRPGGDVLWELPWPLNAPDAANRVQPGLGDAVQKYAGEQNPADAARELLAVLRKPAPQKIDALDVMRAAPVGSWDDAYRAYLGLYAIGRPVPQLKDMLGLPRHPAESKYRPADVRKAIADALK